MTDDIQQTDAPRPSPHSFALTADDGFLLSATLYSTITRPVGRLIVAGATAVPQGFYRKFAEFAAERGFETLTFDYRGIGKSRPSSLKGFEMSLLDWGQLDLAAAVEHMSQGDGLPLYMVGHSYGGHALGLLPNHDKLAGFYGFGIGAGWHGWMPSSEQWKVLPMWHLVLPLLTWWKGYCPWRMLGMGEDLPRNVFWQWRHWCRYPRYFFDDPAMLGIEDRYARVRVPIMAVNAVDDRWATASSRDAFMSGYRNAPLSTSDIHPTAPSGGIGHMGYFRASSQVFWDEALGWLARSGRTHNRPETAS
ncbi:putative alpha/beta hydrolase [Acidovorax sp. 69]|uniref:alpha/beta hydrolase family protein n=1 Tax=Acidovorax sp. 69 TaxID=2035202 RepID=UPI000C237BED|nr:alpha/beta fold hydrolase [Acidovorax sp. 69]PJI96118.1 putative alpha/beta hydrolase [Acidovorax sp. 69]